MGEPVEIDMHPQWDLSEWMKTKAVAATLAAIKHQGDLTIVAGPQGTVLSIPLGGYNTDTGSEQDMTCDKCDKVCPSGLWSFAIGKPHPLLPGLTVMYTGGLCADCKKEENIP